jgi:uncharacterized protein
MSTTINSSVQFKTSVIKKYPLGSFFCLAIGSTWIFMIVDALGSYGIIPFRLPLPLMIVMGYMPTLAALLVTAETKGKAGVSALLRKLLIWRVGIRWYAFAIFGLPVIYITAVLIYNRFSGLPAISILSPDLPAFHSPIELVPQIAILFLVLGIVNGEELAWRGFALPRLQAKYNALTSSLTLGVIWAGFHLPLFFTASGTSQADQSFLNFLVSTTALTILFTWMYNNTRGSVLMAYLLHASANTWTRVFPIDHANATLGWIVTGLIALAAVLVVFRYGAENLSQKKHRLQELE